MQLSFSGQLLSTSQGTSKPPYNNPYTMLEFSPVSGRVFSLKASGHLDLAQYLRKEMEWSLDVDARSGNGGTYFTVTRVSGSAVKSQGKETSK